MESLLSSWSLSIKSVNQVIWTGSNKQFPDVSRLSLIIPATVTDDDLANLAAQVLRNAPADRVAALLSCLSSAYDRLPNGEINVKSLTSAMAGEKQMVCGRVFKKGDIVWTCRECGKDPTCVQCDPCFRKSNHTGHEVYFHRAQGGSGCCDCGDSEAWSTHGNCSDHQPCHDPNYDPSTALPRLVARGFRAVLRGCFNLISAHTIFSVRTFEPLENNKVVKLISERAITRPIALRLHNDDVHSYDEVIAALLALKKSRAESERLTTQADKEGSAVIHLDVFNEKVEEYIRILSDAKLIFSITPAELIPLENRITGFLSWCLSLGENSDGLRRVISQIMLEDVRQMSNPIPISERREFADINIQSLLSDDENQFPSEVTQLSSVEFLDLKLSARVSMANPNAINTNTTVFQSADDEMKDRVRRPFRYCEINPLSLLLISSPFVALSISKALHDMIMKFQHDALFKDGFSQLITLLYPSLKTLFCRHFGTSEDTIFNTTVQVYTANSIVELMSSTGIQRRRLTEGASSKVLLISNMLLATLILILKDLNCSSDPKFFTHHSIRTNRLSMICRDFEYLTVDPYLCNLMLKGDINPGTMDLWIDVCALVQYIDKFKRLVDAHVEREDNSWQHAANLVLELESVGEHLISHALLSKINMKEFSTASNVLEDSRRMNLIRKEAFAISTKKIIAGILRWHRNHLSFNPNEATVVNQYLMINNRRYELSMTKFLVSEDKVSVHIPLHRLLMKLFMFACNGNVSIVDIISDLQQQLTESDKLVLLEYPLRCLVFNTQVISQLWIRNGYVAANLAYNYTRVPLSRSLRDMDLLALQVCYLLGTSDVNQTSGDQSLQQQPTSQQDRVILYILHRFELSTWFRGDLLSRGLFLKKKDEFLADFLRLLVHVVTYLPMVLITDNNNSSHIEGVTFEGVKKAVKREVFHHLLIENMNTTSMNKVKKLVGGQATVSDQILREAVDELCVRVVDSNNKAGDASGTGEASRLQFKDESYRFFDPEFLNFTQKQSLSALEKINDKLKSKSGIKAALRALNSNNPHSPMIFSENIPIAERNFATVRSLLFSPLFVDIIIKVLQICYVSDPSSNRLEKPINSVTLIGRIIQLLTLQLFCKDDYIDQFHSLYNGSNGITLVELLSTIWKLEIFKDDPIYHSGLSFWLFEIGSTFPTAKMILESCGFRIDITNSVDHTKVNDKERLRKAAQERLFNATKAQAESAMKAFGDMLSDDSDEDDDNSEEQDESSSPIDQINEEEAITLEDLKKTHVKSKNVSSVELCILCREKKPIPMGYLCFAQQSNTIHHLISSNLLQSDYSTLNKVYRVVCKDGCAVYSMILDQMNSSNSGNSKFDVNSSSADLQSKAPIFHLPYGEHILAEERKGPWLKVISPVKGYVRIYQPEEHVTRDDDSIILKENECNIISGFSQIFSRLVAPVKDLCHLTNGKTRLFVSTCGHAMHLDCWDSYYFASYARLLNHEFGTERQSLDIRRGECLCPFCKNILNTIIPIDQTTTKALSTAAATTTEIASGKGVQDTNLTHSLEELIARIQDATSASLPSSQVEVDEEVERIKEEKKNFYRFLDTLNQLNNSIPMFNFDATNATSMANGLGWNEVNRFLQSDVKLLHALASALSASAYSVSMTTYANLEQLPRQLQSDASAEEVNSWQLSMNEQKLTKELLLMLQRLYQYFSDPLHFKLCYRDHYLRLVFGHRAAPEGLNAAFDDRLTHLLQRLNLYQLSANMNYPNDRTILELISKYLNEAGLDVSELTLSSANPDSSMSFETKVALAKIFNPFHLPLLAMDLTIAFMAHIPITSIVKDVSATFPITTIVSSFVAAKITQVMIEPSTTGYLTSSSNGIDIVEQEQEVFYGLDLLSAQLQSLSQRVFHSMNIAVTAKTLSGTALVKKVIYSLIPFLEFLIRTLQSMDYHITVSDTTRRQFLVDSSNAMSATHRLESEILYCNYLLDRLKLSNTLAMFVAKPLYCNDLVSVWIEDYMNFYTLQGQLPIHSEGKLYASEVTTISFTTNVASDHPLSAQTPTASTVERATSATNAHSDEDVDENDFVDAQEYEGQLPVATEEDLGEEDEELIMISGDDIERGFGEDVVAAELNDDEGEGEDEDEEVGEDDGRGDTRRRRLNDDTNDQETALRNNLLAQQGTGGDGTGATTAENAANNRNLIEGLLQLLGGGRAPIPGINTNDIDQLVVDSGFIELGSSLTDSDESLKWKLYGIDPTNPFVDEVTYDAYQVLKPCDNPLVLPPLQSSLSACFLVVNMNGILSPFSYPDWSHFNMRLDYLILRKQAENKEAVSSPLTALIPLPDLYIDLYHMTKFPEGPDGVTLDDPALCLVCGQVLSGGRKIKASGREAVNNPGECTLHAHSCGSGTGVFFIVQTCHILLMRGSRACYYPSIYLDANQETHTDHSSTYSYGNQRPMFLSRRRYQRLNDLYLQQNVSKEVTRKRITADNLIRQYWY